MQIPVFREAVGSVFCPGMFLLRHYCGVCRDIVSCDKLAMSSQQYFQNFLEGSRNTHGSPCPPAGYGYLTEYLEDGVCDISADEMCSRYLPSEDVVQNFLEGSRNTHGSPCPPAGYGYLTEYLEDGVCDISADEMCSRYLPSEDVDAFLGRLQGIQWLSALSLSASDLANLRGEMPCPQSTRSSLTSEADADVPSSSLESVSTDVSGGRFGRLKKILVANSTPMDDAKIILLRDMPLDKYYKYLEDGGFSEDQCEVLKNCRRKARNARSARGSRDKRVSQIDGLQAELEVSAAKVSTLKAKKLELEARKLRWEAKMQRLSTAVVKRKGYCTTRYQLELEQGLVIVVPKRVTRAGTDLVD